MNGRVWGRRARRGGENELLEGAPFLSTGRRSCRSRGRLHGHKRGEDGAAWMRVTGGRLPREDVHGPCDDEPEDGDREHGRAGDRACARVRLGEAAAPPEARRHAPRPLRPAGPARPDEVRAAAPDHPALGEGKRDPSSCTSRPVGVDHFGVRPEPQTSIEPGFYGVGAVVLAVDVALLGGLAAIDKAKGWDIIDLPGGRGCCSRRLPCCSSSCCSRCRSPS
jgi:hypothetical protein